MTNTFIGMMGLVFVAGVSFIVILAAHQQGAAGRWLRLAEVRRAGRPPPVHDRPMPR